MKMQALVVDGYNVLYASARYRPLLERDPAVARERLVDDLTAIEHACGVT